MVCIHLVLGLLVPGCLAVHATAGGVPAGLVRAGSPPPVNIRQVRVVVRARAVLVPPTRASPPRAGVDAHLGGGGVSLVVVFLATAAATSAAAGDGEARRDARASRVRRRGWGRQLVVSTLCVVRFVISRQGKRNRG